MSKIITKADEVMISYKINQIVPVGVAVFPYMLLLL